MCEVNLIIMLIKYSISMDEAFSQVFDNEEDLRRAATNKPVKKDKK